MQMRLIRPHHHQPQRWANGLGVTHEVWRDPLPGWRLSGPAGDELAPAPEPSPGPFLMRLSVATLAPGPFSALPGLDRWFVPLSPGVRLDGVLLERGRPIAFPGERTPLCEVAGAATALNLMVTRGLDVSTSCDAVAGTHLVYALGPARAGGWSLVGGDAVVSRAPVMCDGEVVAFSVAHEPRGPTPPSAGLAAAFEAAVIDGVQGLPRPAWVVTAYNPRGDLLDEAHNRARFSALCEQLHGHPWVPVVGRDAANTWREPSAALFDGALARRLAIEFAQDAIFELTPDGGRRVVWLDHG